MSPWYSWAPKQKQEQREKELREKIRTEKTVKFLQQETKEAPKWWSTKLAELPRRGIFLF